jgi:pimeloyl-ACP methyl ester carboxylesterase
MSHNATIWFGGAQRFRAFQEPDAKVRLAAGPDQETICMSDFPAPERISTNGIELEVFSAGTGRPLVLCHGWPELAYSWRYQIAPLVEAGYHVIAPNQRGYGHSSRPDAVTDYDAEHLCGDLTGLLDHYGYQDAVFVGHDWGAIVVWALSLLHPDRVAGVINLSVPFLDRGEEPWVDFWEKHLGGDFYIVHFNRQPGVADAAFAENTRQFLGNIYRTRQWESPAPAAEPGMPLINLAASTSPSGVALMSEEELAVFVESFEHSGFAGGINWYRNFNRNWERLGQIEQRVNAPTLMIYGTYDVVGKSDTLEQFVPDLEVVEFECGHWIQQERPEETSQAMLDWLSRRYPA